MAPLPELNTDQWRERLTYPIGIDDQGGYFPLFSEEAFQDDEGAPLIREVLHHQARVHLASSDYSEATPLLHRALAVSRKSDGTGDTTGHILLTLADLYFEISDLEKAETTLMEAYEAFKQMPHEENRLAVAATHSRLGHVYQMGGALVEAEQNYLHALKIHRRVAPKSSAGLLVSLGALYERMGRYDEAQAVLNEALEIKCDENGECHDAVLLNNLARLAHARGEHVQAVHYVRRALELERNKPTYDLQQQAKLLYNLAESLGALGKSDESFESFKEALEIDRYLISEVISIASERQRQEFLTERQFRIHQCISLILRCLYESQQALEFVAKLIFERKSFALDLSAHHREFFLNDNESSKVIKFRELRELRSRIALETLGNPGRSRSQDSRSSIEEDIERCELLESEISRDLPSIDVERRLGSSGWRDVIEHLPEEAVLIEFFRLNFFDFTSVRARGEEPQQTHKYIAVILANSSNRPEIVDLGDAAQIDRGIAELRFRITAETGSNVRKGGSEQADSTRALRFGSSGAKTTAESGEHLRSLIFDPLVDALRQSTRVIVAPDGNLWRLPFEILPLTNGSCLIDRYEISYLTSGYDLLRLSNESRVEPSHPLVVADPDFDLKGVGDTNASSEVSYSPFSRLHGTKAEGETVAKMLGVDVFSGAEAVEGVVKASSSPAILHLATHGFVLEHRSQYLSPEDMKVGMTIISDKPIIAVSTPEEFLDLSTKDDESHSVVAVTPLRMMDAAGTSEFARLSGKGLNNPMLRSGVALAGANSWLRGEQLPDGAEDGILTAEEVSGLDLRGTELVVLSACETGLGEILSGEGVFGLRRSFVLAGARSLVISLWKIPDIQTKELMIEFYTRLIAGEARSEALRNAQLTMKKRHADPFYWGAFVCQGDTSPLTNISTRLAGRDTSCSSLL
jgi:CHAT domain-containing protein/tetratricopeptide (TPR) repeat protein